jgi:hypothetical protein
VLTYVTIRSIKLVYAFLTATVAACGGKLGESASTRGDGASTLPPPVVANPDGTVTFVPSLVDATRIPLVCGVQNPPFSTGDQFFLDVTGNAAKPPSNDLVVVFTSPLNGTVGAPIMLAVLPYSPQGTKIYTPDGGFGLYGDQSSNSGVLYPSFTYTQGTDPSEIDTGAFDAVTLTVVAIPLMDGDPLTIRVQVHFVDGKLLDETFSGALTTLPNNCPEG